MDDIDYIQVQKTSKGTVSYCHPDILCKGVDISTVPYLDGHVSTEYVDFIGKVYDTKRTIHCLKNQRILILGDSITSEMVYSILYSILYF